MNDRISAMPEEKISPDVSALLDASLNLSSIARSGLSQPEGDSIASKLLENNGVLPSILMFDSMEKKGERSKNQDLFMFDAMEKKEERSKDQDVTLLDTMERKEARLKSPDVLLADGVGGQSSLSKPVLEEPPFGVKERIPGNPLLPSETVTYYDGTKRIIHPDGYIQENRPNGMEIHVRPDNSVTILSAGGDRNVNPSKLDKEVQSTKVDEIGSVIYNYADGTRETFYPSGTHTIRNKDNSLDVYKTDGTHQHYSATKDIEYDKDGKIVKEFDKYPDKFLVRKDGDGRVVGTVSDDNKMRTFKYDSSGELTEINGVSGKWKKMEDEKGKAVWANGTTGKVWHGEFKVDNEGNLHYAPHDQNSQSWVFTRDGRDVPEARKR